MTDHAKALADALETGTAIVKDGQRIAPQDFYIPAEAATRENDDTVRLLQEIADGVQQPFLWPRHKKALREAIAALSTHQQQGVADIKAIVNAANAAWWDNERIRNRDPANARQTGALTDYIADRVSAALSRAPQPDTVTEEEITSALYARVRGGGEVWHWLPQSAGNTPHQTARDILRAALTAALAARGKPASTSMPPATETCPHGVRGPANCHTCTPRDPAPQMRWKGQE